MPPFNPLTKLTNLPPMYTDKDLDDAVTRGIFTADAVTAFRKQHTYASTTPTIDGENFRLIGGFNDIFVVIACALLMFSARWIVQLFDENLGLAAFPVIAWMLAEYFVRKRNMALPAIALLLAFSGGVFNLGMQLFMPLEEWGFTAAAGLTVVVTYVHWRRFRVPITIAAGTVAVIGSVIGSLISAFPDIRDWLLTALFSCGVLTFLFAMYWDSSDRSRITRHSDIAFWLHLLSAPLIIHPVFSNLGIFKGDQSLANMGIVVGLYFLMSLISLAIDRRAFMVSSLIYVLYALSNLLKAYGVVGSSFAVTGLFIGSALLLLSAYWHTARKGLVIRLPYTMQKVLPEVK